MGPENQQPSERQWPHQVPCKSLVLEAGLYTPRLVSPECTVLVCGGADPVWSVDQHQGQYPARPREVTRGGPSCTLRPAA